MNAKEMRSYWINKCKEKNKDFQPNKFIVELMLLKKLIERHGEYVVLEAIDQFLEGPAKPLSIMYFASSKVFDSKFDNVIKLGPILKYKRSLMSLPMEQRDKARDLIQEYLLYAKAHNLSDSEKIRKQFVLKELEAVCRQ
jgi:hypothetical protein